MNRDDALQLLKDLKNSENMVKHSLAAEAAMTALHDYFQKEGKLDGGNREEWGLAGLLHDADYEATEKSQEMHTDLVTEKISGRVSKEVIEAIRGHCDKVPRETLMAKSIYACDELTGLIVAAALVQPDKKINAVTLESISRKFKDLSFARSVSREQIKSCETELGIPLPQFMEITLLAMQAAAADLKL